MISVFLVLALLTGESRWICTPSGAGQQTVCYEQKRGN